MEPSLWYEGAGGARLYCRSWPLGDAAGGLIALHGLGRPLRALSHGRRGTRGRGHRGPRAGSSGQRPLARTARVHRCLGRAAGGPRPLWSAHPGGAARACRFPARQQPRRAGRPGLRPPPPRRASRRHRALAPARRARRSRAAARARPGAVARLAPFFAGDGNGPERTLARPGGRRARAGRSALSSPRHRAALDRGHAHDRPGAVGGRPIPVPLLVQHGARTGWCRRTGAGGSSRGRDIRTADSSSIRARITRCSRTSTASGCSRISPGGSSSDCEQIPAIGSFNQ